MRKFSEKEKKILSLFFSNTSKSVFVLLNMPEVLKGALFSRYSRSSKSLRELFLDDYLNNQELNLSQKIKAVENFSAVQEFLNSGKAKEFYRKWLAMYGDDSIAELGGIHLGIENISIIATKIIEDRRIGLSPLEKSTRYVRFDDKVSGKYRYYRDPQILKSRFGKLYLKTMDNLFETYSKLIAPITNHFRKKYPQTSEVTDKAYEASIRAKACDTLRGLLPLGTLTNMGVFGNGRAFEYLLTKMYASPLPESRDLAKSMRQDLGTVIESFIERVSSQKGQNYIEYLQQSEKGNKKEAVKLLGSSEILEKQSGVRLVLAEPEAEIKAVTAILYPNSRLDWKSLYRLVKKYSSKKLARTLENYVSQRQGRWHKVGKAFEQIYYDFEIVSDVGVYKDLERHRLLTYFRQPFTTKHGYEIPTDVIESGFEKSYRRGLDKAHKTYLKLRQRFPEQAQYLVCHGHLMRWKIKMNLREAFHLCELRSSPQGHPGYRKVAQEIYFLIKKNNPLLGNSMKFVNLTNPGLERLSSEIRKEEKLARLTR